MAALRDKVSARDGYMEIQIRGWRKTVKTKQKVTSQSDPSGPMCSWCSTTPLWYYLPMWVGGGRERQTSQLEGKYLSHKQFIQSVCCSSCWKHQGLWTLVALFVPQVPSNTPPSLLHRLGLYPIQHVCFNFLILHSITIHLPHIMPVVLPQLHPPGMRGEALMPRLVYALIVPLHGPRGEAREA